MTDVKVEQRHRDAAADYWRANADAVFLKELLDGVHDDDPDSLPYKFARFEATLSPIGADGLVEELRDALTAAYEKGASDVHTHWQENPGEAPRGDPEFGEAASDYAAAAMDPFSSAVVGVSEAFLTALRSQAEATGAGDGK